MRTGSILHGYLCLGGRTRSRWSTEDIAAGKRKGEDGAQMENVKRTLSQACRTCGLVRQHQLSAGIACPVVEVLRLNVVECSD